MDTQRNEPQMYRSADAIVDLMRNYSIEVTPGAASKIADFRAFLRPGQPVAVTFLAGSDFADTLTTARRLADEGFRPMPHICARAISSAAVLEEHLKALRNDAGAKDVVLLAGAMRHPVGTFENSMQLLQTGLFEKYDIQSIGWAGHPEGSPDIDEASLAQALQWKNEHAAASAAKFYLCTQFVFDAAPVIAWERKIRLAGNRLPIHIGVPGIATLKTLMKHARACGIGPSMRVLTKQAKSIGRILTMSAPDKLLLDLAHYKASEPECGIQKVHAYPFGNFERSASWFEAVAGGYLELKPDNSGFEVLSGCHELA